MLRGTSILHYDGTGWTCVRKAEKYQILSGIWGSSSSNVFVVGRESNYPVIFQYNGRSWRYMQPGFDYGYLSGIWGASADNAFAVGGANGSIIVHYDGKTWKNIEHQRSDNLLNVWGSSPSDVFAVGHKGTILHYDGLTWSSMDSGTEYALSGIWGSSPTDVFAVGGDILAPVLLHYDGTGWSFMDNATSEGLHTVWGSSATDVYAVGDYGTILHYDGMKWSPMNSGTTEYFSNIYGFSGGDIFAVGTGEILRYAHNIINNEECTLSAIPAKISRLASFVKPLQLFLLIGDTQAFMTSKDKPQWSTSALIPLASMPIGRRLAVVLTLINPFALEPNSELVLYFGMCSGTVEVN